MEVLEWSAGKDLAFGERGVQSDPRESPQVGGARTRRRWPYGGRVSALPHVQSRGGLYQPVPPGPRRAARSMTASRLLMLSLLSERFAIVRLAPHAPVPSWAEQGSFWSITRTSEELSVVCEVSTIPKAVAAAMLPGDWRVLKVHGPFVLSEIGVVAALAAPLADAKLSLFVI